MTMPRETILFWVLAAALVVVGLAFILVPLLRRGDAAEAGGTARGPLALLLAILVPVAAIGLYVYLSRVESPRPVAEPALGTSAEAPAEVSPGEATGTAPPAEPTLPELEARVREHPDDGEGWLLLGRHYVQAERAEDAVRALKRATELLPEQAGAWSAYAEAIAMARGTDLEGEPMEIVYKALELDVKDPKALELAGLHHFSKGNYKQAGFYWTRLLRLLPQGTPFAEEIASVAREARRRAEAGLGVTLGETLQPAESPMPEVAPVETVPPPP